MFGSHGCHDGSVCGSDAECFDCLLDCRNAQIVLLKEQLAKRLSVEDRWNARHPPNYKRQEPALPKYKAHRQFGVYR